MVTAAPAKGVTTYTGRLVAPDAGVPSLLDIAVALSRQPRFGGHTRGWWTVLDHSLYTSHLAEIIALGEGYDDTGVRVARLAALLHDAHEALTADTPTDFKTDTQRELQAALDRRIMAAYFPGGYAAYAAFLPTVKAADWRALRAEALVVGPPGCGSGQDIARLFGDFPEPGDCTILRNVRLSEGDPREAAAAPAVLEFLRLYGELR